MKTNRSLIIVLPLLLIASILLATSKGIVKKKQELVDTLTLNSRATGDKITLVASRGPAHNHPLMAVWVEDLSGNYIQTLYVAQSIAKGVFNYGEKDKGKWLPGEIRRPAALPYWSHRRNVKEADGLMVPTLKTAIPDAYTGATPQHSFVLSMHSDQELPEAFKILFEYNQPWDWNDFWNNTKFIGNENYKTSCQPSVVFAAIMQKGNTSWVELKPIGHGHYAGEDGSLTQDLSTLTTALEIYNSVQVKVE